MRYPWATRRVMPAFAFAILRSISMAGQTVQTLCRLRDRCSSAVRSTIPPYRAATTPTCGAWSWAQAVHQEPRETLRLHAGRSSQDSVALRGRRALAVSRRFAGNRRARSATDSFQRYRACGHPASRNAFLRPRKPSNVQATDGSVYCRRRVLRASTGRYAARRSAGRHCRD